MNIQTVASNLRNTIAGKRLLLATYDDPAVGEYHKLVRYAMTHMLTDNIGELERILVDVDQCVDQFEKLKRDNSDMGWQINPDRMGQ